MKKIKFRAKTTVKEDKSHAFNNVWVEGDLIVSNGRYYIHPRANKVNVDNDLGKFIVMHEVQKDTVCEYTGLKDKNGKEIYENDIVGFYWQDRTKCSCGVVGYGAFNCTCCDGVYGWHFGEQDIREHYDYEVLGNEFDNPELLERGAE